MCEDANILIVDDDNIYIYIAKKSVKDACPKAEIFVCKNGEEALDKLSSLNPDILLLDINMPVMNGWGLLDNLLVKNIKLEFPIFIVSSSLDESDKEKAASYKFVKGYINKPINKEKIKKLKCCG